MRKIRYDRKPRDDSFSRLDKMMLGIGLGLSMGISAGLSLGVALGNVAAGISLGMSLGVCVGAAVAYALSAQKQKVPVHASRMRFSRKG